MFYGDLIRYFALIAFALMFFSWGLIVWRSLVRGRVLRREGKPDEWEPGAVLFTVSYLLAYLHLAINSAANIGEKVEWWTAPILLVGAAIGVISFASGAFRRETLIRLDRARWMSDEFK